jgi:hypothetical protein
MVERHLEWRGRLVFFDGDLLLAGGTANSQRLLRRQIDREHWQSSLLPSRSIWPGATIFADYLIPK